jgi:transcriptional regulator with XRE-family HTH domain
MPAKSEKDRGHLPEALFLLRRRVNKGQPELSRQLRLKAGRIGRYENGYAEPSFALLRRILAGMGLDLHDLQDAIDVVEGRPPKPVEGAKLKPPLEYLLSFTIMLTEELKALASTTKRERP